MTRRHVLHCGPPKTGTSALQAILRSTPPEGVFYPQTGQWDDGAHHLLAFALLGMTHRGTALIPALDDLIKALRDELADQSGTILLSSEHFTPETLPDLVDKAGLGQSLSLVLSLRHPLDRAASAFNQAVKDPVVGERRLPDAFLREEAEQMALRPMIEAWSALPWPVTWVSYHPASSLVPRLLNASGISHPGLSPPRTNRSISGPGLVGLFAAHRMGLDPTRREALSQALRQHFRKAFWGQEAPFPFSRGAAKGFLQNVARPDLEWTFQQTGIDLRPLRPHPPARLILTAKDRAAIESCFAPLKLDPSRQARLTQVLDRFETSDTKEVQHDDA